MTLLARDEADIVEAQLAFHLHAGVDFVIATDNRSQDGTTEILERYQRAGYLHLLREDGDDMRQDDWVTRMARLAATEFGADWVINTDADEFWWPRGGSLKDVLATIPERYGAVRGCWRHFLPRPEDGKSFSERMTVRLAQPAPPGDKRTIYHAHQKVAHRADPTVEVEMGNHDVIGSRREPLRGWHPIEVLHFSFRSLAQLTRKGMGHWSRRPDLDVTLHQTRLHEAYLRGRLEEYYDVFVVSDEQLERGLADGTLAIDTRLRDVLRSLQLGDGSYRVPETAEALEAFARPGVTEDASFAGEVAVLAEIDGAVRAEARADALERRLAALEGGPVSRLRRIARR